MIKRYFYDEKTQTLKRKWKCKKRTLQPTVCYCFQSPSSPWWYLFDKNILFFLDKKTQLLRKSKSVKEELFNQQCVVSSNL